MQRVKQKQIEDFKRQLEQSFGATSLQEESTDIEDDEEDDQEFGLRRFNAGSSSFFFGSDEDAFQ